jgi:Fe-S cluster assembly iron-binding protein IscA
MLRITRQANRYLRRAREEAGLDSSAGARLVRTPGGVGLTFAAAPERHDRVAGEDGVPIYLDEHVAAALDRSVIDVSNEDGHPRLVIRPQLGVG